MVIQYLSEIFPPHSQNPVGVCKQITLLVLFYISSKMVTLLKLIDTPTKLSDILYFVLSFKFISFSFQIFLPLFSLKCLLASHLTLFRLSTSIWFRSSNNCILVCFPWSKNRDHSSQNHGLYRFGPYKTRLSLAAVLVSSSMFSQTLLMSLLSFKFSKAANLFDILIWYCFVTSSSLSLLRLNLYTSKFCAVFFFIYC